MRFQRCIHSSCRRPFQVNEFGGHTAEFRGTITCPHCGHSVSAAAGSVFLVHAMSPEEEAAFNLDFPSATESQLPTFGVDKVVDNWG
ncbi:hypothetical protein [Noviherbaspirillum sp. ST9]|uniref:hypothetical protein n=1 Tax=Noviherbaspirillum sp. ST9 TaxID=3401606 RepID=UPI003B58B3F6